MRHPSLSHSLRKLKKLGVPVNSVLDVGVLICTADLVKEFRSVPHLLVEPIVEFNAGIREVYGRAAIDFRLENAACGAYDGTARMEVSTVIPGKAITHARVKDGARGEGSREVPLRRLDTMVAEHRLPDPFLLKIDVDGSEIDVLKGGIATLERTSVVVIEAQPSNILERIAFMTSQSFDLFDITDLCFYDEWLAQFDLVFINSRTINKLGLRMIKGRFQFEYWQPLESH